MKGLLFSFIFLLVASYSHSMITSKEMEGFPNGYLSDCPGSTKPAIISPKSLKHLSFTIVGRTKRRLYNYYQMKLLAKDPEFDKKKKTMVYFTAYLDSPNFFISPMLSKPYREFGYNVLLVDTIYFTTMEYSVASRFSRTVGKHVAEMLVELTKLGLNPKQLELLGMSLGAQTMSFVAKNYQIMTNSSISRLTGLDPAGPCFRRLGPDQRLDQSDADFVEVVMTNIDGFGSPGPVGHVNYYVNGGEYQPGAVSWFPCNIICSHLRSSFIWTSAFYNRDKFIALRCESVQKARDRDCFDSVPRVINLLGPNANKSVTGIFYLATNNTYPYYLGEDGLKKENEVFYKRLSETNQADVISI